MFTVSGEGLDYSARTVMVAAQQLRRLKHFYEVGMYCNWDVVNDTTAPTRDGSRDDPLSVTSCSNCASLMCSSHCCAGLESNRRVPL